MTIVVDTNIVFSAILNSKSIIGDLILNSNKIFQFQSCYFLQEEIDKHWDKLLQISKLKEGDLLISQRIIYQNINFINEAQIHKKHRIKAYELVKDIDLNDIAFIALNEHQKSLLWTGDKVLVKGLKSIGYENVITTEEMVRLRRKIEMNK